MNKIESLVRPNIRVLCPYSTARDEYQGALGIFLDANESPYPTGYNRYPDPRQKALKEQLSAIKGLPADHIFLGNGSDEAIDLVFRIFCTPGVDNAVAISPSYGMYAVAADINDIEVRNVLLGEDFSLPKQALLDACDEHTKLLFACSPNTSVGTRKVKLRFPRSWNTAPPPESRRARGPPSLSRRDERHSAQGFWFRPMTTVFSFCQR